MKTIKTYYGQPILDIAEGISAGEKVKFGVFRDRSPDSSWGELHQVNLVHCSDKIEEKPLTENLRIRLLSDLAYAYGDITDRFEQKLKEFGL